MKIYITDKQSYDSLPLGEVNSVYGYLWEGWLCKSYKDGVLMYDETQTLEDGLRVKHPESELVWTNKKTTTNP